jgi:RNA polymerase sigma-70 factor (family 1)
MLKIRSEGMTDAEFEEIYDVFWGKLYALAYNYFRDKTTAQELVQDVFVHLWMKRSELGNINDLGAYLCRCMKNKIYDQFDSITSRERLIKNATQQFTEENHVTEEALAYEETLALLNQEIDKLPPTTQTIFRLSRFDRYTNEEIASRMHVSAKSVEYHITLALKKLRPRLNHVIYILIALLLLGS